MARMPEPVPMSAMRSGLAGSDTWEALEDGFYEELGLGAGDEDGGGDVEGEAVELLGSR